MRASPPTPPALPQSCPLLEDANAADQWVPCCSKQFHSRARSIVGEDSLAEDALQDSWPKVLRGIPGFQGSPTACNWVSTIVANSAKDIRRKRLRRQEVVIDETLIEDLAVDTATRVADQQMLGVLHEMVERLPEPYRQVIEMRLDRELSTRETARRLEISPSSVASRLHRGLRMLRHRFTTRIAKTRRWS